MNEVRISWRPDARYNIAPTQTVPVVLDSEPQEMAQLRWGLIPWWAKDMRIGSSLINARRETVASKPAFREAFKKRRCLIPADGFYEWQRIGDGKVPQHIWMLDREPFAFAGLWERWRDPALGPEVDLLRTCTIITTDPNELMAEIHDRMPVILPRESYAEWLSPETSAEALQSLLRPYPADRMEAYAISKRVNSPRYDDPSIVEPLL